MVNDEYAGPRLHATIRASQNLIPRVFFMTYQHSRDDMLPFYEDENAAMHRRDPEAAREACIGRSELMAKTMLAELCRRGVFPPRADRADTSPEPLPAPSSRGVDRDAALESLVNRVLTVAAAGGSIRWR